MSREADGVRRLYSREFGELACEALNTERETVIALRNEESIKDEVLRRIQHDIDLAEARLSGAKMKKRGCAAKSDFKIRSLRKAP